MKIKNTLKAIRSLGLTASHRDGEFRVNLKPGREETAYYTNDADDALGTARLMAGPAGLKYIGHSTSPPRELKKNPVRDPEHTKLLADMRTHFAKNEASGNPAHPPPGFIKGEHMHDPRDPGVYYPPKVIAKALRKRAKPNPAKRKRRKNPGWYIHIQKSGRGPVMLWNGKSFTNRPDERPMPFASQQAALYKARHLLGKFHRQLSPYKIWVSDQFFGIPAPSRRVNPSSRKLDEAAQKLEDFTGRPATEVVRASESDDRTGYVLGEMDQIDYKAAREGVEGGRQIRYRHKFRKGSRPLLAVSTDGKQLRVVGGQYVVTEAGIEDR